MTAQALLQGFFLPLLVGGEVRLGLPLSGRALRRIEALGDEEARVVLEPAVEPLWRRGRAIWARLPRPELGADDARVAGVIHDALAGLHPFAAGRDELPEAWAGRREYSLGLRADACVESATPPRLVRRHLAVERALALSRHDAFVQFRMLGEIRAVGHPLEYRDRWWRVVVGEGSRITGADESMPPGWRRELYRVSPLSALDPCVEDEPLPRAALDAALRSAPLARWIARRLLDARHVGYAAVADAFVAGRPWPDRAARGRWLDLCHYLVLHGSPPRSPAWDLVQHALETSKRERRT